MGKSRARRFRRVPFSPTGPEPRREVEGGPEEEPAAELLQKVRAGAGGGPGPEGRWRPRSGERAVGGGTEARARCCPSCRRPDVSRVPGAEPPSATARSGPAPHAAREGGPALPVLRALPCARLLSVCLPGRRAAGIETQYWERLGSVDLPPLVSLD